MRICQNSEENAPFVHGNRCMVVVALVRWCAILDDNLAFYTIIAHTYKMIGWVHAELSCSCLALCSQGCLEKLAWVKLKEPKGAFLWVVFVLLAPQILSMRGFVGAYTQRSAAASSSHQIQRFPPSLSLCVMVTCVASVQIVSMQALVGGPCTQEHNIVSSDHLSHPPNP